jgi:hypothetical protein
VDLLTAVRWISDWPPPKRLQRCELNRHTVAKMGEHLWQAELFFLALWPLNAEQGLSE